MRLLTRLAVISVIVAACSSSVSGPPAITPDTEATLSAEAVVQACEDECAKFTIYVRDVLHGHQTRGETEPMPDSMQDAIGEQLGDVTFVDLPRADALFGEDWLVDGGAGVLISVGPVLELAEGVVGIEVGVLTARDGGRGQVRQFQWDGEGWEPATSEDTGVTVTSWVS